MIEDYFLPIKYFKISAITLLLHSISNCNTREEKPIFTESQNLDLLLNKINLLWRSGQGGFSGKAVEELSDKLIRNVYDPAKALLWQKSNKPIIVGV